jgi:predicted AAA+ superfamily ATPase
MAKFQEFLDLSLAGDSKDILSSYHDFLKMLVERAEFEGTDFSGDLWKDFVFDLLLFDENPFSLICEAAGFSGVGHALLSLAARDLQCVQFIYNFDFHAFVEFLHQKFPGAVFRSLPPRYEYCALKVSDFPPGFAEKKKNLFKALSDSPDWALNAKDVASFYKEAGCGKFGRYWGFKLVETKNGPALSGIPNPDPIKLSDLVGYESQKKEVVENTRQFVSGCSANNMLLYGDRGTGKSSTIKALLHEFGKDGLRLVEVPKYHLMHLNRIISELRTRPQRFIIFIDDLSFEENETEYKFLKSILEGSLEAKPENVLIYATSNRRHLVREFHSDAAGDEIKSRDTVQEKLSLSDRFGITVIFPSPDKMEYLQIVEGLAQKRGIKLEPEKLRELALKWELWNNQRSGRTARQFIDDLAGKIAMGEI